MYVLSPMVCEYDVNISNFDKLSFLKKSKKRKLHVTANSSQIALFNSLSLYGCLNSKNNLDQFAREASNVSSPLRTMRKNGRLGANLLLWDLGVDDAYDVKAVEQKILEMDNTFHMVMILEHFDESVALMRNLLCWSFLDVTSLKLNSRTVAKVLIKIMKTNFSRIIKVT